MPGCYIGCTGAGGTGKTSVCIELAQHTQLPYIQCSARPVFQKWGLQTEADQESLNRADMHVLQQEIFEHYRVTLESAFTAHPDGFITDRTLIDSYAYGVLRTYHLMTKDELQRTYQTMVSMHSRFTLLLIFSASKGVYSNDGVRIYTPGYTELIDLLLAGLIYKLPLSVAPHMLDMPAGSIERRVQYVTYVLQHNRLLQHVTKG